MKFSGDGAQHGGAHPGGYSDGAGESPRRGDVLPADDVLFDEHLGDLVPLWDHSSATHASSYTCLHRPPETEECWSLVNAVLDEAAALLAADGPAATSIDAVAGRLGVDPNKVRNYVEDDRMLIGAVAERGLDENHRSLGTFIGAPETFEELAAGLSDTLRSFLGRLQFDPGFRQALAFIDADPHLGAINLADTRRNAHLFAKAIKRVGIDADVERPIFLLTHLSGSLASLAARVDEPEASELVEQYEKMVLLFLASASFSAQ